MHLVTREEPRSEPPQLRAKWLLIEAHLTEGNRAEALRQHRSYERLLRDELDIDPVEVRALVQQVVTRIPRSGRAAS